MPDGLQLVLGFGLAGLVGWLAWRIGALAPSGGLAAMVVGGFLFGFGGLAGAVLLLVFFVSSSALSRAFAARKAGLAEKFEKGSRRDWAQALANGGVAAFCAAALPLFPEAAWPWLGLAGALATANGDTWATELGTLSRHAPRLITTFRPVPRGTSGGVTLPGTAATLAGAGLVGALAALLLPQFPAARLALAVTMGGFAGAFVDSVLGATLQGIYRHADGSETEKRPAPDAKPVRGLAAFNNDVVNFLATAAGALIAMLLG